MMCELLNNGSVSAFVGAFSAFLLVILTDRRRLYRNKSVLMYLVSDNLDHARSRIDAVKMNLALIQEDNKVLPAPFMRFPTQSIRDHQFLVLDILNANEKQGLDALVYWMDSIDDLLASATGLAIQVKTLGKAKAANEQITAVVEEYIITLQEAEKNLNYLVELLGCYISGQPHKILEFKHPVGG